MTHLPILWIIVAIGAFLVAMVPFLIRKFVKPGWPRWVSLDKRSSAPESDRFLTSFHWGEVIGRADSRRIAARIDV